MINKNHRHSYEEEGDYLICKHCGKKILNLKNSKEEGILIGKKSDGKKYTVRTDRRRYFFPKEWIAFIEQIKNKEHKFLFLTLLHTGARIMEALNLKYEDIDEERWTVKFNIVKQRKAKRNFFALGTSRGFFVAENYIKEYKSFIRGKKINPKHYIFLDNEKLPENYDSLSNKEKRKYYGSKIVSYSVLLKSYLKKAGITDWYNFSLHNIRKTYGMWMKIFGKDMTELCYRMGHDINTYMTHYGSSLIFTEEERRTISKIFGEIK